MKTVMKKMFSLLLVAVLLVSAVPFAASAAEETKSWDLSLTAGETYSVDELCQQYYSGTSTNYWVQNGGARGESFVASADRTYTLYVVETVTDPEPTDPCANGHTPGADATCSAAQTCTVCGTELAPKTAHTPGAAATCSAAQTCTVCGTELAPKAAHTPGAAATCSAAQTCTVCGTELAPKTAHTPGATATHTTAQTCTVCGDVLAPAQGHAACVDTVQVIFADELNGDKYEMYNPGETISLFTPEWVSGYSFKGWKLDGQSGYVSTYEIPVEACESTITFTAQWNQTTVLEKYPVSVYARLKIGGEVQDVDLIHRNSTLLENDKIMDYLKHPNTMAALWSTIETKYPGYTWSENFHNAYGETAATDNITVVDGSKSVYINLYSEQDEVLLYVYAGETCEHYDYLYELDGYKHNSVNDTVTAGDVRSFLKEKFGSGISIKMFDEAGFKGYVNGKENTATNYVAVKDGTTKIHVRLYNAYSSSSSSSSKVDTSNPKTGDMIFNAVTIMGASAACLAALFYLNKKRAV